MTRGHGPAAAGATVSIALLGACSAFRADAESPYTDEHIDSGVDSGSAEAGPLAPDPPADGSAPCSSFALAFFGGHWLDVADSAALDGLAQLTLEAVVLVPAPTGRPQYAIFSHASHEAVSGYELVWEADHGAGGRIWNGTGAYRNLSPIPHGTWTHVAFTFDGSAKTSMIFVDGELRRRDDSYDAVKDHDGGLRIGADLRGFRGFSGQIDEIRISRVVRYSEARPASPRPRPLPVDAETVAAWRFDEGAGTTVLDATRNGHDAKMPDDPARRPAWIPIDCPR